MAVSEIELNEQSAISGLRAIKHGGLPGQLSPFSCDRLMARAGTTVEMACL
jgi:hypothetical protein